MIIQTVQASLGYLSVSTFLDLNDNDIKDPGEPVAPAALGEMPFGQGAIVFSGDTNAWLLVPQPLVDNTLTWLDTAWEAAYRRLFADVADVAVFREIRDRLMEDGGRGYLYTALLYRESRAALDTFKRDPELMQEAKALIVNHREALDQALAGEQAIITDSAQITGFLERFGRNAPKGLRMLTRQVIEDMVSRRNAGEPFLGFILQ
ncbi:hypothetical protein [Thiocapsa sp.]|uniref:hypothetical protein n=1 Tax=Thiocapsa sp. TaxID=2024551 RepID=UPI001BD0DEC2|nr:hypothetical protein [Thiocapsa sp.]